MTQSHQNFIYSLYQIGVIQFGEFQLKSGELSSYYINLRKIISYPTLLMQAANLVWDKVQDKKVNLVCGVPYTALPIATCLSLIHHVPMIMRRKEKKEYGTKQMIEGEYKNGQSCLVVEDVITTGGSLLETSRELEQAGLIVKEVVALVDREQGGFENLSKHYQTGTVLTLSDIFTTLFNSQLLNSTEKQIIEEWMAA